jgi:hypothetical protein
MSLFANIILDEVVQVNDKVRINGVKSFVSKDETALTAVEIKPSASDSFINVFGTSSDDWFLDWQYSSSATETVSLKITNAGGSATITKTINVISEATDNLFSTDDDLMALESNIMDYLKAGKSSYKYMHRKAQTMILEWLDDNRIWDNDGNRLTKEDVVDVLEVREYSRYLTLALIFQDLSNETGDVYERKYNFYLKKVEDAKKKATLKLDLSGDGTISSGEYKDMKSIPMRRA